MRSNRRVISILFSLFFASVLFVGCNYSKGEIDDKCRSGVVLILNQYYYSLTLPGGDALYFKIDGKGEIEGIETDVDSVSKCINAVTGTGFLISSDGRIATNKHVACRNVSDNVIKRFIKLNLKNIAIMLEEENNEYEKIKRQCEVEYYNTTDEVKRAQYVQIYNAVEEKIKENNEAIKSLSIIDPEDGTVQYHSQLKIAYNGTFVKSIDDMFPCSLRDTSAMDVAIIQLNSKQTPVDKYVFTVPEKNLLEHYSFGEYLSRMLGSDKNEELYMIGFNHGLAMAITDEGIYSQCTEGTISRTERDRIMYTIPSIQGSSGSPILNRRGQLVAINFAGWRDAQSFNYGVKEKYLYELMNNE